MFKLSSESLACNYQWADAADSSDVVCEQVRCLLFCPVDTVSEWAVTIDNSCSLS